MADDPALDLLHQHYELGLEEPRLDEALGSVEFARTLEVAARVLPPPPAVVADIGGGPGRYALEFAGRGYTVVHRDLVPLHVEQLRAAAGDLAGRIRTESVTPGISIWTTTVPTPSCSSGPSTTWSSASSGCGRSGRCGASCVRVRRCW